MERLVGVVLGMKPIKVWISGKEKNHLRPGIGLKILQQFYFTNLAKACPWHITL